MAVGIIRKLDPLGRLTIPIEIREYLGIKIGDYLSLIVDGNNIIATPDITKVLSKAEIEDRLSKKYSEEEIAAIIKELEIED